MKSSAISLRWKDSEKKEDYLVNLIDSPGHVDFTSEVSTAARLADAALVIVDAVEGISSQTREVLRQAWHDELRTILVINKIDRLFINLHLTPDEAYLHIHRVIEQANAAAQELICAEVHKKAFEKGVNAKDGGKDKYSYIMSPERKEEGEVHGEETAETHELEFDDERESFWTYRPSKGNVFFCSAVHGWGFSIQSFSKFVSKKIGASEQV